MGQDRTCRHFCWEEETHPQAPGDAVREHSARAGGLHGRKGEAAGREARLGDGPAERCRPEAVWGRRLAWMKVWKGTQCKLD